MRKTILAILLALALVLIPVGNAFAASSVDVSVYATPMVLSITVTPDSWYINWADTSGGHSGTAYDPWGDNRTRPSTTYFSNPLGDNLTPDSLGATDNTECLFLFTNLSGVPVDISCSMSNFAGGDPMDNGDGGYTVSSDNVFGASGYVSGTAWPAAAVIFQTASPGNVLVTNLGNTLDIWWGAALLTRTNAFETAVTMTSTITCTAAEHL